MRVIECYDLINQYDKILETLSKHRNIIPIRDREVFIRKYAPLAMEALV